MLHLRAQPESPFYGWHILPSRLGTATYVGAVRTATSGSLLAFDKESLSGELSQWALREGDTASPGPVEYVDRPLEVPLSRAFESVIAVQAALDDVTSSGSALHDLYLNHPGFDAHLLRWEGGIYAEQVRRADEGQGGSSGH